MRGGGGNRGEWRVAKFRSVHEGADKEGLLLNEGKNGVPA